MARDNDMTTPVTRGELREELEHFRSDVREAIKAVRRDQWTIRKKQILEDLNRVWAHTSEQERERSRAMLAKWREEWLAMSAEEREESSRRSRATLERISAVEHGAAELSKHVLRVESRVEILSQQLSEVDNQMIVVSRQMIELPKQLSSELAQHTNSVLGQMRTYIDVIEEKYQDLPSRVTGLEADAAPKRKRR